MFAVGSMCAFWAYNKHLNGKSVLLKLPLKHLMQANVNYNSYILNILKCMINKNKLAMN